MLILRTLRILLLTVDLAGASIIFDSPYDGQNPGTASDQDGVIGMNGQFDIQSLAFSNIGPSNVTVQIDYNYDYGDATLAPFTVGGLELKPGDLLFSAGGQLWGIALVSHPVNFGDPIAGDLYSQTYFLDALGALGIPGSGFNFNGTDLVWITDGESRNLAGPGTVNTVNIGADEVQTTLSFAPDAEFYSALTNGNMAFDFASADCANDYLSGTIPASSVPEPASLALMGAGVIALSFISCRRFARS